MSETRVEYGVFVAEGPHEGMLLRTFRKPETVDVWKRTLKPDAWRGGFTVRKRTVTESEWEAIE